MTTSIGTGRRGGRISLIPAGAALICAALVAASALAAPPLSETTKAKMAAGHWTSGGPGLAWQPEPDRPYVYNPPLRPAASPAAATLRMRRPAATTQIDDRALAGRRAAIRPLAAAVRN
jgi:hypothetical protein